MGFKSGTLGSFKALVKVARARKPPRAPRAAEATATMVDGTTVSNANDWDPNEDFPLFDWCKI
jgi:hypothetical protein